MNGDCRSNLVDFATMSRNFRRTDCGSPDHCEGADLDGDGDVDLDDFKVFAEDSFVCTDPSCLE